MEDFNRSFLELRLDLKSLELELELKSPELKLELELKLIVSSGIGIGIENNGIGIGIELKKRNWPQPCNHFIKIYLAVQLTVIDLRYNSALVQVLFFIF